MIGKYRAGQGASRFTVTVVSNGERRVPLFHKTFALESMFMNYHQLFRKVCLSYLSIRDLYANPTVAFKPSCGTHAFTDIWLYSTSHSAILVAMEESSVYQEENVVMGME